MASAIYVFNDLRDIDYDIKHPTKKLRPIASGTITQYQAVSLGVLLVLLSLGFSLILDYRLTLVLSTYLIINIAYTLILKEVILVDIFCISFGFILRLKAGSIVTDIELSWWIIGITLLLSLFLALGKRRDDVIEYSSSGTAYRRSAINYSLSLIDSLIVLIVVLILVGYIWYTFSPSIIDQMNSSWLFTTAVWVIIGLGRYLYLIFRTKKSGSPTKLLWTDIWLQFTLVAWIINFFLLIY